MKCTYIMGANSEIAKELINEELKKNEALYLFTSKVSEVSSYIKNLDYPRKVKINIINYNLSRIEETVDKLLDCKNMNHPDKIFVMVGLLGDEKGQNSDEVIKEIYNVNVNYIVKLFDLLSKRGYLSDVDYIAFSSSVGSDLFFKRLFDYYESKRLLDKYIINLSSRFQNSKCGIVNLKIGPVYDTRMGPSKGFFRLFASKKKDVAKYISDNINKNAVL